MKYLLDQGNNLVRIGVLSDTHLTTFTGIPGAILKAFARVDLIIHAGDFTEKSVLEGLKTLAQVKAVCGNMDSMELRKLLPAKELFVVNNKKIGVAHGSGGPWEVAGRVKELFPNVDIIIYGHSHQANKQYTGGMLLFNPGRARDSFGIITIDKEIVAELIKI